MTVQAVQADIRYVLNGAGVYAFDFEVLSINNLLVQYVDPDGVYTEMVAYTDYTPVLSGATGYIDLLSTSIYASKTGFIYIKRDMVIEQPIHWVNNDPFDMAILEASFDRVIMILQQFGTDMSTGLAAITWRGTWATGVYYAVRDEIRLSNGNLYVCTVAHTSGTWATDLAAGNWAIVQDSAIVYDYMVSAQAANDSAQAANTSAQAAKVVAVDAAASASDDANTCETIAASLVGTVANPLPIGTIIAIIPGYFTGAANTGYTPVIGTTIAQINNYYNPLGFYVCNGAMVNVPESAIFNGAGRYLPNFTDNRFIMGASAVGAVGGANSVNHTHTMDHTHTTGSHTLSATEMPSHTHTSVGQQLAGTATFGHISSPAAWTFNSVTQAINATGGGCAHNHGSTTGISTSTSDYTTVDNRPAFLSAFYLMRVS